MRKLGRVRHLVSPALNTGRLTLRLIVFKRRSNLPHLRMTAWERLSPRNRVSRVCRALATGRDITVVDAVAVMVTVRVAVCFGSLLFYVVMA